MVRVDLTPTELLMGQTIGTMRQATIELSHNKTCQRYAEGVLGALGEIAVAKALNMFWDSSLNTFKSRGDVGDVEVRTTTRVPPIVSLYVTNQDHDDRRFVLVSQVNERTYDLLGWMAGSEAKQRGVYESKAAGRAPAYWLLHDQLHDMENMPEFVANWQQNILQRSRALHAKALKQRNI